MSIFRLKSFPPPIRNLYGVDGFFQWMEKRTYKMHIRVFLSRYRAYKPCNVCNGGRFQPETLNYRLPLTQPLTLPEIAATPVSRLAPLLSDFAIPPENAGALMLRDRLPARLSGVSRPWLPHAGSHDQDPQWR